ncbi:MAG: hypothetical protein ACR2N7_05905, partial [Acidimicrobiia bacterium]
MRRYVVLFALLALALTACRVESNVILDIEEDGSATVGAELGFDEEFQALIADSGAAPDDLFNDLPDFGGDDVVTTERTEGDMTFYGVATSVDDLSSFDISGVQADVFSSFDYQSDDDSAALNATISATDLGEFGGGDLPIDPSQITDDFFSANVIVRMPGTVTESNADSVLSDGALVWKIPFSGSVDITASSSFGETSRSWILLLLVVVLLIGIVAAVVATVVSRNESKKTVAAASAAHETSAPPPSETDVAEQDAATEA